MILTDYFRFLRLPTYHIQTEPVRWKSCRGALFGVAFLIFFVGMLLLPTSQLGAVLLISTCVVLLILTLMGYQPDIERAVARHVAFNALFLSLSILFPM